MAAKKTAKTRPRRSIGKWSASSAGAIVPYAASPTPTVARAVNSAAKLRANPASAVATLQTTTPAAIRGGRFFRSPSEPKIGDVSMYTMMKPLTSDPSCVSVGWSSDFLIDSRTAEITHRSM